MKFISLLVLSLFSSLSFASLREQGLGSGCYFLRQKDSSSLCHPTVVAREEKRYFHGHLFFSEDINNSGSWKKVIDGKAESQDVVKLVEDDRKSYLMSETQIGVVGNSWALSFKPYDLWAKTRIQNPSNPYAHIDAGFAQVLSLHLGHYLNDEFSAGVIVDAAQIKTLKRSFFVTDLLVDNDKDFFRPKSKGEIVVSPGFAFEPKEGWLDARLSVFWRQSYITDTGALYAGSSFENKFKFGTLEWGLGSKFEESEKTQVLGFFYYSLGMTTLTTSLSEDEQNFAAFLKVKNFDVGLSYAINPDDRLMLFQMGFLM